MSPLFRKSEKKTVAIFDIGNGSIGFAVVELSRNNLPNILYSYREPITFLPDSTNARLLDSMLKLLKSVSAHVQKQVWNQYHRHVRDAYCIFAAPWFVADTRVVKVEKEEPFFVSRNTVDDILKKDEQQYIASLKEGDYENIFGINLHMIEKKIIHTRLNGYEVGDFLNKNARQLEIMLFSSFMADTIPKKVEDVINQYFHFRTINFNSYALASWLAMREIFPHEQDFIFLDISAEMTDIMLVEKGVVVETDSFAIARSSILRSIVDKLAVPPEVAVSFLNLYNKRAVEQKFAAKIDICVKEVQKKWWLQFIEALKTFENYQLMPKKIFITADTDVAPLFAEALKQEVPAELELPEHMFEVVYLGSETAEHLVHKQQPGSADSFIALESAFLNKIVL